MTDLDQGRIFEHLTGVDICEVWVPDPETESELGLAYREGAFQ